MFASLTLAPFLCWLLPGLLLLLLELVVPGVYLFWFGLAALATGACVWLFGAVWPLLSLWEIQILLFIAFSIAALCAARNAFMRAKPTDAPFLNRPIEELLGQSFILQAPLSGGRGHIVIHDTRWPIQGADMPKGAKIRLIAYHRGAFSVERAE